MSTYKLISFATVLLLSACAKSEHLRFDSNIDRFGNSKVEPAFETVRSLILTPYCVSCHQQYSTYTSTQREAQAIYTAVTANRMPKGAGGMLPDSLKALLQRWVAAGAPEQPGQIPSDPELVVLQPNWNSIHALIITPRCLVCHNPQGQAKFLDLSSRQAIYMARNRIFGPGEGKTLLDFDKPGSSYLLDVIQDPVEPMPPVLSNIRRLNKAEIDTLIEWIGLGLP